MRCKECNVDLPETYTKCPLCGNAASDDELQFKNIKYMPYPRGQYETIALESIKTKKKFSFEKIKAFLSL